LSELLPLAVLGIILGYVYYRTGNLLASMLLHSLWNGGSMLTLYLLAS
jgi:membrane protease YdiL (CAAX protease family)